MLFLVAIGGLAAAQLAKASVPWKYRELFVQVAREVGGDENLLHALAWHESNLDPLAISPPNRNGTRDYGLMQINETNFAHLGLTKTSALDAEKSARAAARVIAEIGRTPGLSLIDKVSEYNAGPSSLKDRRGLPKRNNQGGYVNPDYIYDVAGKYAAVTAAAFALL